MPKQTLEQYLANSLRGKFISIGRSKVFKEVKDITSIPNRTGNFFIVDFVTKEFSVIDMETLVEVREDTLLKEE